MWPFRRKQKPPKVDREKAVAQYLGRRMMQQRQMIDELHSAGVPSKEIVDLVSKAHPPIPSALFRRR